MSLMFLVLMIYLDVPWWMYIILTLTILIRIESK